MAQNAYPVTHQAGRGGVALGLTVLVSIGSLSILLPAFPALALMFVLRRPQSGPFGIGLFAGVACSLYAGLVLARPYLSSISADLHLFGLCAGTIGGWLKRRPRAGVWLDRLAGVTFIAIGIRVALRD